VDEAGDRVAVGGQRPRRPLISPTAGLSRPSPP
jgi:hypothetical protein